LNRGRPLGLSRHSSYRITIRCASNEATPHFRELSVRSPSPGVARCSSWSLSGSRREDLASRWSSSLPPASEERRLASRYGGTKLVLPGANPPRLRTAGGAHRAACLPLELVVELVLRRVHPAESLGPRVTGLRQFRQAIQPSGATASLDPRQGSELPVTRSS
jgi:hypothetical protein